MNERKDITLKEGTKASDFTLPDQNGKTHSLSDYRGKRVILYFYPKDMTSGCTSQACSFMDLYPQITEKGAVVLGVSRDSVERHKKFEEKYNLNFTLLSDPEAEVIDLYETTRISHTKNGDRKVFERCTYLIDADGVIETALRKVKAKDNAAQMLEML